MMVVKASVPVRRYVVSVIRVANYSNKSSRGMG